MKKYYVTHFHDQNGEKVTQAKVTYSKKKDPCDNCHGRTEYGKSYATSANQILDNFSR